MHPELQSALIAATSYGAVTSGPLIGVSRTTAWRWVQQAARRAVDAGQQDEDPRIGQTMADRKVTNGRADDRGAGRTERMARCDG